MNHDIFVWIMIVIAIGAGVWCWWYETIGPKEENVHRENRLDDNSDKEKEQ